MITGINSLNSQFWAAFLIVVGLASAIFCWHCHLADTIPAGVVGAGVTLFTTDKRAVSANPQQGGA